MSQQDLNVDAATPETEYDIGYAKPPIGSRFRPGQSGNPRGRPKGRKSAAQLLEDLLAERVTLTINGKRKRLPMDEVVLRALVNKAVAGDVRSIRLLDELRAKEPETEVDAISTDTEDEALIAAALARRAKLQDVER